MIFLNTIFCVFLSKMIKYIKSCKKIEIYFGEKILNNLGSCLLNGKKFNMLLSNIQLRHTKKHFMDVTNINLIFILELCQNICLFRPFILWQIIIIIVNYNKKLKWQKYSMTTHHSFDSLLITTINLQKGLLLKDLKLHTFQTVTNLYEHFLYFGVPYLLIIISEKCS